MTLRGGTQRGYGTAAVSGSDGAAGPARPRLLREGPHSLRRRPGWDSGSSSRPGGPRAMLKDPWSPARQCPLFWAGTPGSRVLAISFHLIQIKKLAFN